ncbi:MAG: PKD domain-containing protein [Candidatus Kapaibacterium sp.]
MFRLLLFVLLCNCAYLTAQDSGWADSVGFKQQKMKTTTGKIVQIIYSQQGDSLYTLTKDSVVHIYTWDANTGVLLKDRVLNASNLPMKVKRFYTVNISTDARTYHYTAADTSSKVYTCIFDMKTDSLLYKILLYIGIPSHIDAMYDSTSRLLWTASDEWNNSFGYGPDCDVIGRVYNAKLSDTAIAFKGKDSPVAMAYSGIANGFWFNAIGKSILAYKGYSRKVHWFRGNMDINESWMGCRLIVDNKVYSKAYQARYTEAYYEYPNNLNSFTIALTQEGFHYLESNNFSLSHYVLPSHMLFQQTTLSLNPSTILTRYNAEHALLIEGRTMKIYHLLTGSIVDSLTLPTTLVYGTYRNSKQEVTYIDSSNTIKQISFTTSPSTIKNDFKANVNICYKDSILYFVPTIKERYTKVVWSFGDGETDTSMYPSHRYKTPGVYTVTLRLTDSTDFTEIVTKVNYITVLPELIADFSATPLKGKAPLAVTFKDESKGVVNSWKWDFGDGSKLDSAQSSLHLFTYPKSYDVTLTVSDLLSTKKITKVGYIVATVLDNPTFNIKYKYINRNINKIDGKDIVEYVSEFRHGILSSSGKLLAFEFGCTHDFRGNSFGNLHIATQGQRIATYNDTLSIDSAYKSWQLGPYANGACAELSYYKGGFIKQYRNNEFVATHFNLTPDDKEKPIYISNPQQNFHPKEWSDNFEVACLKNNYDVFVFRYSYKNSIQFFNPPTVLINKDSIYGDVVRPIPVSDSQNVVVFSNPYKSKGDSSLYIVKSTYSNKGVLLSNLPIKKSIQCRISDVISLGNDEYIISGYIPKIDSTLSNPDKGYLCKVGNSGNIVWEVKSDDWLHYKKIQQLSNLHYSVWGDPKQNPIGFITINSNGKILSDNRVELMSTTFTPSDFIVNTHGENVWFVGKEYVAGQGYRSAIYSCTNPVLDITSDVEEHPIESTQSIVVYPQPTSNILTVQWNANSDEMCEVQIVNQLGSVVYTEKVDTFSGVNSTRFTTSTLNSGVYYITIRSRREVLRTSFIVLH